MQNRLNFIRFNTNFVLFAKPYPSEETNYARDNSKYVYVLRQMPEKPRANYFRFEVHKLQRFDKRVIRRQIKHIPLRGTIKSILIRVVLVEDNALIRQKQMLEKVNK